jgi:midasin (ATPase involved in ribosome maturation)
VLERLNSVFETGRTLFLAEKGGTGVDVITAAPEFKVFATMNPGGDFGKKELSPALRNRFTEIWVPPLTQREDLLAIVEDGCGDSRLRFLAGPLLDFVFWFNAKKSVGRKTLSLRDVLAWVEFMNKALVGAGVTPEEAYVHGSCLVVLDGLGIGSGASVRTHPCIAVCYQSLAPDTHARHMHTHTHTRIHTHTHTHTHRHTHTHTHTHAPRSALSRS